MQWQKTHIQGFFYLALCGTLVWGCQRNPGGPEGNGLNSNKPVIQVSGSLTENTTWQAKNTYLVTKDILVPQGITLEIRAGTEVRFDGFYQLVVHGTLKVLGEKGKRVKFLSNKAQPGADDWDRIWIEENQSNSQSVLQYFEIEYARYGIFIRKTSGLVIKDGEISHCFSSGIVCSFDSSPIIDHVRMADNEYGIRFSGNSNADIRNCLIETNTNAGIESVDSNPVIYNNIIRNNAIGIKTVGTNRTSIFRNTIMLNDEGILYTGGSTIVGSGNLIIQNKKNGVAIQDLINYKQTFFRDNNIYDNKLFNIAVGIKRSARIPMPNNWWGTIDENQIAQNIQDGWEISRADTILFRPYALAPVDTAGAMTQWPEPKQ